MDDQNYNQNRSYHNSGRSNSGYNNVNNNSNRRSYNNTNNNNNCYNSSNSYQADQHYSNNNNNNNRGNGNGYNRSYNPNHNQGDYYESSAHSQNSYNSSRYQDDEEDYYEEDSYSNESRNRNRSSREVRGNRRSRSRSRSPPSSRRSRYHNNSESDSLQNLNQKESAPNNTLMIRNLPLDITEKDLANEINKLELFPKDVRLMRHKDTGQSRGFAFVEFGTLEQAIQLKETTQGLLKVHGKYECFVHYSLPRTSKNGYNDQEAGSSDWNCLKCNALNFQRRDECFKCGTRRDITPEELAEQQASQPTNFIWLKNLSSTTTEAKVLEFIVNLSVLPIKSIKFQQDAFNSMKSCSLELHSVHESEQLFNTFREQLTPEGGLPLDGGNVMFSYGHKGFSGPRKFNNQQFNQSGPSYHQSQHPQVLQQQPPQPNPVHNSVAQAALAAAQWNNLGSGKQPPPATTSGQAGGKFPPPNYTAFQYDATSGFYYDSTTGYYYDSASQYFYNSATQKYMYYDPATQNYLAVEQPPLPEASTAVSTPQEVTPPVVKDEKSVSAKKIAKDMEKWAKVQNHQKVFHQQQQQQKPMIQKPISSRCLELGFDDPTEDSVTKPENPVNVLSKEEVKETQQSETATLDRDPFEMLGEEEAKLIDRTKLACLLCKRQFNAEIQLDKHQKLSGLHKNNLRELRRTLLTEDQLAIVESIEASAAVTESASPSLDSSSASADLSFRDRAAERRQKYGREEEVEFGFRQQQPGKKRNSPSPPLSGIRHKQQPPPPPPPPPSRAHDSRPPPPPPPPPSQSSSFGGGGSGENIGSKMLKAMGWKEGSGLGKSAQGRSDIIQVESTRGGLGLGNHASAAPGVPMKGETYQDAVRRTALERFKRMNE